MKALAEAFDLVDLNGDYAQLRMRKSDEEIQWMRIGAALSDLGIEALAQGARPGMTERELGALVERDYHALGGTTTIHFIGINDMQRPDCCVPPQYHSSRRLKGGDMMFVEFTASFWDSPGQVLRSFTVEAEPTPLFRDLYATAEAAFKAMSGVLRAGVTMQEIVDASGAPVKIAAVNWFGMETTNHAPHGLWTENYKVLIDKMVQVGFNTIRLPFSDQLFAPGSTPNGIDFGKNPDLAGLNGQQIMDKRPKGDMTTFASATPGN